jgi:hypothetical protein
MINQEKVKSGFDVEALFGERYLTYILLTALDAGVIPLKAEIEDPHLIIKVFERNETFRLYEADPSPGGEFPDRNGNAFDTEILFGHPLGADLRIHVVLSVEQVGVRTVPFVPIDLFVTLAVPLERDPDGALIDAGLAIHVVDLDSPAFLLTEDDGVTPLIKKEDVLPKVQEIVDGTIDISGTSNFKRVEAIALHKHPADDDHPAALGFYLNVRLRTGDQETDFKDSRGSVDDALNFLPDGEDIAFASRPGLYTVVAEDAFHRTAFKTDLGTFEHALRPDMFNPKSKRIGTVHSVSVSQINQNGTPVNGLRITVEAEYEPDPDVNPDVTFTIDIVPTIGDDGLLHWSTNLDVSVDALFEFLTLFAFAWLSIMFGGFAGVLFLGLIVSGEIGAGIYLSDHYQEKVAKRADATLTDVILDRLKIQRRRWDPFFTTIHEVVIKPSQAEFNNKGFLLSGKAFVGREAEALDSVVIRDETRDSDFNLTGLRYRVDDFADIQKDLAGFAPGVLRRDYAQSDPNEPELYDLTFDQIRERFNDKDGPLLFKNIPYFPARVHLFEHKIEQILCISALEIAGVQRDLRTAFSDRKYAEIKTNDGDAILEQVRTDLSANGATPTDDEIEAEVEARIQGKLSEIMRSYNDSLAIQLARDLRPLLRFDVSPVELAELRDRQILTLDEVDSVQERLIEHRHRRYLRDHPDGGTADNLQNRPRYRPTPTGPEFTTDP